MGRKEEVYAVVGLAMGALGLIAAYLALPQFQRIIGTLATNPRSVETSPIEPTDKAIFFDALSENNRFPPGRNQDGRSWYSDGGYHVRARDTKNSWIWVMPDRSFINMILEVDVMPETASRVTGYVVAIGWEKGDNYLKFEVQPDGECGFLVVRSQKSYDPVDLMCPKPTQNDPTRIHLEVRQADEKNSTCMRAFINSSYIGERCFDDYTGGLIGLGTYNGGTIDSGVEAQVRFNNLVILKHLRSQKKRRSKRSGCSRLREKRWNRMALSMGIEGGDKIVEHITLLELQGADGGQDALDKHAAGHRVGAEAQLAPDHGGAQEPLGEVVGWRHALILQGVRLGAVQRRRRFFPMRCTWCDGRLAVLLYCDWEGRYNAQR